MATTKTLYASPYQQFVSRGGTRYTADANGVIVNVAANDSRDLVNAGANYVPIASTDGLALTTLKLCDGLTTAGAVLTTSTVAGAFYVSSTVGTSFYLLGEVATSNTKTDDVIFEQPLPANYVAGSTIAATVNAQTKGAGTAGTVTVNVKAYRLAQDGTQGANLCATGAQAITSAAASYAFAITGTTLSPGDRLLIEIETVIQETAGGSLQAQINSLKLA